MVATERQRTRCREQLEQLGDSNLDREALQVEAIGVLRGLSGFDRWCWPLADAETFRKVGVGSRRELLARFGDAPGEL